MCTGKCAVAMITASPPSVNQVSLRRLDFLKNSLGKTLLLQFITFERFWLSPLDNHKRKTAYPEDPKSPKY